jgi:hypothetical protein
MYCGVKKLSRELLCKTEVEGKPVDDDTGCSRSMVRRQLVDKQKIEAVTILYAHGDVVYYPVAEVQMSIDGKFITVVVAVFEDTTKGSPCSYQVRARTKLQ